MNAARRKRKTGPLSSFSSALAPFFHGAGRRALVLLALVVAVPAGAIYAWQRWGGEISKSPEYVLLAENIEITRDKPEWIKSDIRAEVVRDGSLTGLSILDKQLTIKVEQAFLMHNWVEQVTRVNKYYPARVVVELVYRKPVAMVEVWSPKDGDGLLPIDINGVLLPPEDFKNDTGKAAANARDYLRISVPNAAPAGLVGSPWGDPRVEGAARIAAVFEGRWKALGLYRIAASRVNSTSRSAPEPTYDLFTKNGVRVIWGEAPAAESMVEAKAAMAKVARLARIVDSNGPLESMTETTDIDLRGRTETGPHTALLPSRSSRGANVTSR